MKSREDMEKALWELYGETVKAVTERVRDVDAKPADIANAIKLLQSNSVFIPAPKELNANPQLVLDKLEALPFGLTEAEIFDS
jgi:hypothetical protein